MIQGLDCSAQMLELARQKDPKTTYTQGAGMQLHADGQVMLLVNRSEGRGDVNQSQAYKHSVRYPSMATRPTILSA